VRLGSQLLAAVVGTAVQSGAALARLQGPTSQPGQPLPASSAPLFASDDVIQLTLETDLRAVIRDRDSTRAQWHPATLTYVEEGGSTVQLAVEVKTRGHWRLDPDHCDFPQLRLDFPGEQPPGSPFAGQDKLKLTTPCRPKRQEHEQYVLREYLVYRLYRLLTPLSFHTRLALVTYVDAGGRMEPLKRYSFFVEDQDQLVARHGARLLEIEGAGFEHLDFDNAGLVSLFEYMIGGTDWSIWGLHNIRLMQDTLSGTVYAVPYDFDWSGLVDAEYAVPDERLRLSSVRQRLYRGQCRTEEQWVPIVDRFAQVKDAASELYEGLADLHPKYARETRAYLDAFYRVIGDPASVRREIIARCRSRA
jgi:hypothetical protein